MEKVPIKIFHNMEKMLNRLFIVFVFLYETAGKFKTSFFCIIDYDVIIDYDPWALDAGNDIICDWRKALISASSGGGGVNWSGVNCGGGD